jgi:UDP-N-acetylglucosamine 2-epimerase (non-hydrolysing)
MRILCAVGTRPEAVKMAPVIKALRRTRGIAARVVGTGQHRELLDDTLREFGIETDVNLKVMQENQTLAGLTGRLFPAFGDIVTEERPDMILGQGDTTTVFVASVVAFYGKIPFGHVEAGLRTHDLANPFPEEFNRVVAGRTAALHFAPTEQARKNLLREGASRETIHVTGNTVIDALLDVASRIEDGPRRNARTRILMTAHRRENFGQPMEQLFHGIRDLVGARPELEIVYPVHPNPNVAEPARRLLGDLPQVKLSSPLGYRALVAAMKACDLVLTDSGGIQEEAPALGKPVLVLREATERPEAVHAGVAKPIGTDRHRLVREVTRLLDSDRAYAAMARGVSPYGDGRAADRIVAAILARQRRADGTAELPSAAARARAARWRPHANGSDAPAGALDPPQASAREPKPKNATPKQESAT